MSQRWAPAGVMILRRRGRMVRGQIADLSTSGVKLRIESLDGVEELAGRRVGLELRLEGPDTEWLYLRGRVVRVSATFLTIAIAFEKTPLDFACIVDRAGRGAVVH
jgi:hypothetical protein